MLPIHQQANDGSAIAFAHIHKLFLCYLFAQYDRALANADIAEKNLAKVTGLVLIVIFNFYDSLSRIAVCASSAIPYSLQDVLLDRIAGNQEKMQHWAAHAPMNHLHKYHLVEAERHRLVGKKMEAMEMYDRAIAGAKENEYLHEEALANELAAKLYLDWGKEKIARVYMQEAHYCYTRCNSKSQASGRKLSAVIERSKGKKPHDCYHHNQHSRNKHWRSPRPDYHPPSFPNHF